jgi:hypothetical protein
MLQWYILCACRILHILVALNFYQQAFLVPLPRKQFGIKILIMIMISANLVYH